MYADGIMNSVLGDATEWFSFALAFSMASGHGLPTPGTEEDGCFYIRA